MQEARTEGPRLKENLNNFKTLPGTSSQGTSIAQGRLITQHNMAGSALYSATSPSTAFHPHYFWEEVLECI